MAEKMKLNQNAERFFAESADAPPAICAEQTNGSANVREVWEKIHREARAMLKPPPVQFLSRQLADWVKACSQKGASLPATQMSWCEIQAQAKAQYDTLLALDLATSNAGLKLDEIQESMESLIETNEPERVRGDISASDKTSVTATLSQRKAALLQMLFWLEGLSSRESVRKQV